MTVNSAPISSVLVIGFGVLGRGIARLFAGAGMSVSAFDPHVKDDGALPAGIRLVRALPKEAPDLVVEAIVEVLDAKIAVFRDLEAAYGAGPIIASNTSGLPLQEMADALKHPERFIGMHFFTPADVTPLVEVVRVAETGDEVIERAVGALEAAGREAIVLSKPVIGYLWNRLQHAMLHEAYHLVENGIVKPEDIDKVAKKLLGPRFCVTGLLEGKDIFNLEPHILAQKSIVPHLNLAKSPCAILERKLERKEFGIRTGKGFYDWQGRDAAEVAAAAGRKLRRLGEFLENDLEKGEPDLSPMASLPLD
ncbi:3-hydroxyacyl-CoA dehydrogenase family protein [Shumkonia mesophila]|uniref:3-hydroxyacyl-CoA dehydrogenase family protein n=1 Tax=Shumkonia mesophila TaxID=2838854 RepID=UPI0029340F28|nr:3-hydroxyacyl-CoA dehydrogenase NAD-binding domain-containing protein [Shumkonia mesophila]